MAGAFIMLLCNSWASSSPGEGFPKRSLDTVVGREQRERRWKNRWECNGQESGLNTDTGPHCKKHRSTSLCCYQSDPMPKEMKIIYMHQWGYFQLTLMCPTSEFFPGFPITHPWGSTPCAGPDPSNYCLPLGSTAPMKTDVGQGISSVFHPLQTKSMHFPKCYVQFEVPRNSDKVNKGNIIIIFLIGLKPSEQQINQDEWKCWQYQLTSLL